MMISESVHISGLIRIGEIIRNAANESIYAPRNLLSVLDNIASTYGGSNLSPECAIHVTDWSGEKIDPTDLHSRCVVSDLIEKAKRRLT
jgi:hypothetical protein